MGLKRHPCLTPLLQGKNSVLEFITLTAQRDLEYISLIMLMNTLFTLRFSSFVNKPLCQTESYAFLKSTKHPYILPLLVVLTCLAIADFSVKTWSDVVWFSTKPIWVLWIMLFSFKGSSKPCIQQVAKKFTNTTQNTNRSIVLRIQTITTFMYWWYQPFTPYGGYNA